MAKVTFSGLGVTEARGSTGNKVYSRNRGGAYTRNRTIPNYPASSEQLLVAAAMASLVSLWQLLDDWMRIEWSQGSLRYELSNSLGRRYRSSGFNYFMKTNFNLAISGVPSVLLPPPIHSPAQLMLFTIPSITVADFVFNVVLSTGANIVPADMRVVVFVTDMLSSGVMSKTNGFNGIDRYNPGEAIDGTGVLASYIAQHGALVVGKKVFVRLVCISRISGQRTEWRSASCIIT